MIQNYQQWFLLENHYGLAAGTYYDVDQYKITKHVTFDVPFCETPQVWMRERESQCLSYGNPNSGRPFSIITNVTTTGFDLEYVTYYVRTNTLGQTINQWIPASPASTNVAYTAIGVPDFAAAAGPISGPDLVCSSGATFSINIPYSVDSIIWETVPYLTVYSGQYTDSPGIKATGNGSSWVTARLVTDCGSITLPQQDAWAGKTRIDNIQISNHGGGMSGTWCMFSTGNTFNINYQSEGNTTFQSYLKTTGGNVVESFTGSSGES